MDSLENNDYGAEYCSEVDPIWVRLIRGFYSLGPWCDLPHIDGFVISHLSLQDTASTGL